jgi:hypothetical protein
MTSWLIISLVLTIAIGYFAPQQLPVSLYKLSLIATAAWMGYWLDRSLFPYARPGETIDQATGPHMLTFVAAAMLRRAIIISAAMIGVALGA